jgi:hypothetical protein
MSTNPGSAALLGDPAPAPEGGAQPPAGAPENQQPPAPEAGAQPPAAEPEKPWYEGLPTDKYAYIQNKGWQSPADVLESYTNIEKTLGLPADARADALLVAPKADAPEEARTAFLEKATKGFVPETPEGYGFDKLVPDGVEPPPILSEAAAAAHAAGLPAPLASKFIGQMLEADKKAEAAFDAQSVTDLKDLAAEYGDKFDDNMELGRRALRAAKEQAGLGDEAIPQIERAIGTKAMLKLFATFGKNMTELPAPDGTKSADGAAQFQTSPAAARAKIEALKQDSAFMARYLSPNPGMKQKAIDEMEALQKIAAGGA